jgi:hypothetical protein
MPFPPVPDDLTNFLHTESERARDDVLNETRAVAIRAYFGEAYGDEQDGRSQAVTRDVSEVTDIMLVGIMGTVLAGGKAVEFDTEPEQVPAPTQQDPNAIQTIDYGEEATAAVHYQFMRKQPGYRIIHDCAKAGMLEKTGIIKTYAFQLAPTMAQHDVPGGALVEAQDGLTLPDGTPVISAEPHNSIEAALNPVEAMHRVKVSQPGPKIIRDINVPNEWFLISPDAVELDDAAYLGDKRPVSASDLVQLGFDRDDVETLWSNTSDDSVVASARDGERGATASSIGSRNGASKQLWLWHEFPLFDMDGDGVAERLDVLRVGSTVLRVVAADEQPYSGWSPIPMQHRFTGQSMADKTMDIQRIRSVLLRQSLDSIYLMNAPRTAIHEDSIGENTIDDMLTVQPGAIIRYKGAMPPTPYTGGDTSGTSFAAMQAMRDERDSRTGVTAQSQGMNADSLNKTASGMAMLQQNADQIELYVTRNLCEQALLPMFAKRYRLMRAHQAPFRMKINGSYRLVDPSRWPEEPDMQINVGLGTGSKDQRIGYRLQLAGIQADLIKTGSRLVGEQQIYNSTKALIEDTSLGVATDYIQDPSRLAPQPEQPNPEVVKAQADAQTQQAKDAQAHEQAIGKLQLQQQAQQASAALADKHATQELQIKAAAAQQAHDLRAAEAEQAAQLANARAAEEAQLARDKQEFEMRQAVELQTFNLEQARRKAGARVDDGEQIASYRSGGNLSE